MFNLESFFLFGIKELFYRTKKKIIIRLLIPDWSTPTLSRNIEEEKNEGKEKKNEERSIQNMFKRRG